MSLVRYLVVSGFLLITACDFQPPKTTSIGGYELQLRTDPSPLMVGKNSAVSFLIRDGLNQPVVDCNVRFRQYMPGHEMSLDNTFVPMSDPAKVGKYEASSGDFGMGGDWVLEFDFTCGVDHYTMPFDFQLEWPE